MKSNKHQQLQDIAIRWLYNRGCTVFAQEVPTYNGIADALGIRYYNQKEQTVYYLEAKATRSDLFCKKQKGIYARSITPSFQGSDGIDFYYFVLPDGLNLNNDEYPVWGVINERGNVIRRAKRIENKKPSIDMAVTVAHVLVYKVFGKLYQINQPEDAL